MKMPLRKTVVFQLLLILVISILAIPQGSALSAPETPSIGDNRRQIAPGPGEIFSHMSKVILPKYAKSSDSGGPRTGDPRNGDSRNGDPRNGDSRNGDSRNGRSITVLAIFADRGSYRIVGILESPNGMPMSLMADFVESLAAEKVLTAIVPREIQRDPDNRGRAYFCIEASPGPLALLASGLAGKTATADGETPSGERVIEISPSTVGEKLWAEAESSAPVVTLFFFAGDIKVGILDTPLTRDESLPLKFYSPGPVNVSVESGDKILLFKTL